MLAAVERLGAPLDGVADFIHGTTAALNALLERRGARLAMLVTEGFRDVYEIGRANRPEMYDIHWRRPPMLLRRRDVFEVAERLAADGSVLAELDEDAVRSAARGLRDYDAVAVCLLHAYANPEHEQRVRELVLRGGAGARRRLLARGRAGVARVRALVVHRRLRVCDAGDRGLPLAPRRAA